jgi:hypothetical protein
VTTRRSADVEVKDLAELQKAIETYFNLMAIRPHIYVPGGHQTPDADASSSRIDVLVDGEHWGAHVKDVTRDPRADWLQGAIVTVGFYSFEGLEPTCVVGARFIFAQFKLQTRSWFSGAEITAAESLGELFE